jgi:hypothetical protein
LETGGYAILSVPTPLYPRIMGRQFHEDVGHLVDGYGIDQLNALVPPNYRMVSSQYTTGPLTWPACYFFYRYVRHLSSRLSRTVARLAYYPVRYLDLLNGPDMSVSLFVVYQKMPTASAEQTNLPRA